MHRQCSLVLCSFFLLLPCVGSCRSHDDYASQPSYRSPEESPSTKAAEWNIHERANPEMQRVLDALDRLGGKPIETLEPEIARLQPTPADAVHALVAEGELQRPPTDGVSTEDSTIPGPAGPIPIRIYTPSGDGPFPVVVYYHGGGWVIADLDTYDGSARALASGARAIVVSSHYRQAPEHPFPAAHEDAFTAYRWVLANAPTFDGDADEVAVAGESAGGNMAASVCLMAREANVELPKHQLLIYPVTSTSLDWPSVEEFARAKPLSKAMLPWFLERYAPAGWAKSDPRLDLMGADVRSLPPATVIVAEIDPLRDEGLAFAQRLERAGVPVEVKQFSGVTHEFFGMTAALDAARQAQAFACTRLVRDLGAGPTLVQESRHR